MHHAFHLAMQVQRDAKLKKREPSALEGGYAHLFKGAPLGNQNAAGRHQFTVPQSLKGKSAMALRNIANAAVKEHGLDASWAPPKTNSLDAHIEHLNSMSNEHGLTPGPTGHLVKSR